MNLNEMKSKELKEMAKKLYISNWWNMKKADLIAAIEKASRLITEDYEEAKQQAWENHLHGVLLKNRATKEEINEEMKAFDETWKANHPKEVEEKSKKKSNRTGNAAPKRGAQIEYEGKSQNICAWAKELGISANTLYGRIYKMGWSVEKAFTTKPR